jgi:hypothetical protein
MGASIMQRRLAAIFGTLTPGRSGRGGTYVGMSEDPQEPILVPTRVTEDDPDRGLLEEYRDGRSIQGVDSSPAGSITGGQSYGIRDFTEWLSATARSAAPLAPAARPVAAVLASVNSLLGALGINVSPPAGPPGPTVADLYGGAEAGEAQAAIAEARAAVARGQTSYKLEVSSGAFTYDGDPLLGAGVGTVGTIQGVKDYELDAAFSVPGGDAPDYSGPDALGNSDPGMGGQ